VILTAPRLGAVSRLLELRLEHMKSLSNIQHKLLKSFYDGRPVTERYLDRSVAIHIHVFTSKDCFCLTSIKAEGDRMFNSREMLVFVRIGEVLEELRPVASLVRLQPLEHCNVFWGQSSKMPQVTPEILFRIYNNKLRFIYNALGVEAGQLIDKVLQGFPQALDGLPDEPAGPRRSRKINWETGGANRYLPLLPLDIDVPLLILQGNVIGYHFDEGLNLGPESVQVFPCPVNLLISAIERLHGKTIQRNEHIVYWKILGYFIEQKGGCSLASTIRRRTFSSLDNQ